MNDSTADWCGGWNSLDPICDFLQVRIWKQCGARKVGPLPQDPIAGEIEFLTSTVLDWATRWTTGNV